MRIKTGWAVVATIAILATVVVGALYGSTQKIQTVNNLSDESSEGRSTAVEGSSRTFIEKPNPVDEEIDYVWDQMHRAGVYERAGKLPEAAEYYKKGFHGLSGSMENIIPGRSMCATSLIDVYQKIGRYDEALEILDILDAKVFRGEFGRKRGMEIRSRLLAAKAAASNKLE